MNVKSRIKISVDVAMSIVLFVLMSYQITGQKNHEIAGAVMMALFVSHHALNTHWYMSLGKGRYSIQRVLTILIDFLLLIIMLALMISGIRMSGYVFQFIHLQFSMELARNLHMVCSYLSFLLMGLHIGFHYGMLLRMFRRALHITKENRTRKWVLRGSITLVNIYGISMLIKREFIAYITLQMHFVFYDYEEPVLYYIIDLLAIMILMISLGYLIQSWGTHQRKRQST